MGNNTSSTRKSAAAIRHGAAIRKSSQSQSNHHNLEEEFSDLILHEVKRQKQEQKSPSSAPTHAGAEKDNFTNDLIDDEFNELNDGILDTETSDVLRSFLLDGASDDMELDAAGGTQRGSSELVSDLSKVDFTKIAAQAVARQPGRLTSSLEARVPHENGPGRSASKLIPVEIKWVNLNREAIGKVAIIGLFSNWRDVIKLKPSQTHPNEYSTTVKLQLGVHKLLYIINNEYRVLEQLPTATDQEGIFFNWFDVLDPHRLFNHSANQQTHVNASTAFDANIIQVAGQHDTLLIQKKSNSFLAKVSKDAKLAEFEHVEHAEETSYVPYHDTLSLSFLDPPAERTAEYSSDIPEMFVNYDYFKNKAPDYELTEPPQLPAHLNNVLLNKMLNQQLHTAQNIPVADNKRPALRRADSLYYASNKQAYHLLIPNHVILNHLMTTSIRNDVLTVACITRYSGKFVTQIMHSPADAMTQESTP